ncbi:uncharacterized protein C16G5.07c-like isoform X8 [Rosa rugosa]|uniref:uncharacterized protein C16G5.07c-like isoform X8 n=1 Tax=Rosa rugosa TaxID=74645 RepID=UPI002B40CFC2|nr:uncharacterized protein C16G5.07c-like isoform X8 [Rosa rugosa]
MHMDFKNTKLTSRKEKKKGWYESFSGLRTRKRLNPEKTCKFRQQKRKEFMSMFRRNCLNALRSVRRLSHLRFRNYASCGCVGDAPAKFGCSVVAPKDHVYVIERFDEDWETLMPGESVFLFPMMDKIAHVLCSNEKQLIVPDHTVFTNDLCPVTISGLISLKIEDALRASYLPEHPMATAIRRAQTAMRSAVGRVAYDNLYLETRYINNFILDELDNRFLILGLRCLQFDIRGARRNGYPCSSQTHQRHRWRNS